MKKVLVFVTVFFLYAFTVRDTSLDVTKVYIAPESSLKISGTSNVNSFTCAYNTKNLTAPVAVQFEKKNNKVRFQKATLVLDNLGFDCGNRGINRDFHSLIKTKEYPQLYLRLKEIQTTDTKSKTVQALVEIEIAGISKSFEVPVQLKEDDTVCVSGKLKLQLSDFNLEPPKKVLGLIVVHDTITIDFRLMMNV